jgi:hypothetical protein
MCKELPVILVNKVVDPKIIIGKKWMAKEEERHKGSLTPKKILYFSQAMLFNFKTNFPGLLKMCFKFFRCLFSLESLS